MAEEVALGEDFEKQAEENLTESWGLQRSNYKDAVDHIHRAAFCYELVKSCDTSGETNLKFANRHLQMTDKTYVDVAQCYVETSIKGLMDQLALAEDFKKKAENNLTGGWGLNRSKYENDVDLLNKAGGCYKLAKSWDKAEATYVRLRNRHLQMAAQAYVEAAHCYKETDITECISWLEQAIHTFDDIGKLKIVTRYCKDIAKLHEIKWGIGQSRAFRENCAASLHRNLDSNIEKSCAFYESSASLYQNEDATYLYECKLKVAQFAGQLKLYPKAIKIFEEIAKQSLNSNSLKNEFKKHLLNAGICHLLESGVPELTSALEYYQELDPTFSGTSEYKYIVNIAAAIDKKDVVKLTYADWQFSKTLPMDRWTANLLVRLKMRMVGIDEDDVGVWKYVNTLRKADLLKEARLK